MADKTRLTLSVASKQDFAVLNRILVLLVILSTALSTQPLALTLIAVSVIGAGWGSGILYFSNVNDVKLILVIYADGQIRIISSCGAIVEGFLDGQQWWTSRIAILKVSTGYKTQNLVVLSGRQATEDYRRLNVWLRQGAALLLKSEGRV